VFILVFMADVVERKIPATINPKTQSLVVGRWFDMTIEHDETANESRHVKV